MSRDRRSIRTEAAIVLSIECVDRNCGDCEDPDCGCGCHSQNEPCDDGEDESP
jgi:hypothetical protein